MRKPKRFACLMVALVVVGLCGCGDVDVSSDFNPNGGGVIPSGEVHGSGVLAQEERSVVGFTGVVLAGEGSLHIEEGVVEALIVKAEDNLLPYILTQVQGGILKIRTQGNVDLSPTLPIEYQLTVASLKTVRLSGVGDIAVSDLVTPQLSLTLSGVGDVEVTNLDADELDVALSGVGDVDISGTVDLQNVNITGVGDYHAGNLASQEAAISISGYENQTGTVRVRDTLTVTILGNGKVLYIGAPFVDSDIIGKGSVQQISG